MLMIRILTFAIAGPPIPPLLFWLVGQPVVSAFESGGKFGAPAFLLAIMGAGLAYYTTIIPWLLLCLIHWGLSRGQVENRPLWLATICFLAVGTFGLWRSHSSASWVLAGLLYALAYACAAAFCAWLTDKQYAANQATPEIKSGH